MAKKSALKVFRTAIGFHDAYVAAPSMKAALEAWGASRNLFASGAAERVTDEKLAAPALAKPGMVLKVLRGTRAEQLAALGARTSSRVQRISREHAPTKARGPRPSRAELQSAEALVADTETRHRAEIAQLDEAEAALKRKRAALLKSQTAEVEDMSRKQRQASDRYGRALAMWKESDG